jgi:hypothetical protein
MAYWAELDDNNIVVRVTVGDNNDPNEDQGYQWLIDNLGGNWVETSYNASIRKNYAEVGYSYDPIKDWFYAPQPYSSWKLDDDAKWQPPTPMPKDNKFYLWNETTLSWDEV